MFIFFSTGGEVIQRESDAIIRRRGKLADSEAVSTGPGNLPCSHIIHVAGPRWQRGKAASADTGPTREEDLLWDAVTHVLREAQTHNVRSISIPAISSGIYGFPLQLCAETIVDSALDFCNKRTSTSVREIRFTNIDQPSCDAFLNVFRNHFGEDQGSRGDGKCRNVLFKFSELFVHIRPEVKPRLKAFLLIGEMLTKCQKARSRLQN